MPQSLRSSVALGRPGYLQASSLARGPGRVLSAAVFQEPGYNGVQLLTPSITIALVVEGEAMISPFDQLRDRIATAFDELSSQEFESI